MLARRSFLTAAIAASAREAPSSPPNIVFILADDLGYGDVACYNPESKIPTPHVDKLAAGGVRFTDAHTPSAVCTPTRYGLLTGRYAWRTRLKNGVLDGFDPPLIEKGRITVASLLKQHGYRTACIGKWHLGMQWTTLDGAPVPQRSEPGFRPGYEVDYRRPATGGPTSAGFDSYFGISASLDMSPYCFIENGRTVGVPDVPTPRDQTLFMNQAAGVKTKGFELEHVMPACVQRATEFIADQGRTKTPFFLYMPLSAPHLPIVPNRAYEGRSRAGRFGDFVVEVDDAVGAVNAALDRAGVAGNTLVFFSSDNGGLWHWWNHAEADDLASGRISPRGEYIKNFGHAGNARWRGTKADIWEGGHRVPFIARWPRRMKTGVSEHLICLTDLLATCSAILNLKLPRDAGEDSVSILPVLLNPRRREPVRAGVGS
jgi:arylsulfatase A